MANASRLIFVSVALVAAAWLCDVIGARHHPTYANGEIGYSVTLLALLPIVGQFAKFSDQTWKVIRVVTVLLAIPLGLWAAPPMMDVPAGTQWNQLVGLIHYSLLIASFAVAFLLIRTGILQAKAS